MARILVMIHGMWGGSWSWEQYRAFFEERGYDCHTPVLRYHDTDPGALPHPKLGTTSLTDYARDLEDYVLGLDEVPYIVGHSMGGLLGQMLGGRGLARGLVLLTPAPPAGINALRLSVVRSFWRILTKWGCWRNPHRMSFEAAAYAVLNRLPPEEQKPAHERFVYESGRAAAEIGFWLLDPRRAAKVDETTVTCPVLVIAGAEDRITPASVVRKVARKYGNVSEYREFDNHAHWLLGEPGWEEIAEYVADWLGKITAGTRTI